MRRSVKWTALTLAFVFILGLTAGCGQKPSAGTEQTLKVGVTAGPHAQIMDVVKKVAEKDGLKLDVVEFNDYIQPNVALNQGDIAINSYQHQPFLDNQVKDRGYQIVSIAKTVIFPMGIYSKKFKSIDEITDGATVAIPNDPTNGGRALFVLEKAGLIKLKPNAGLSATAADIAENPKQLKVRELEAAQIPRSLDDVDFAAINTNYAVVAGLVPTQDALAMEDASSPYANIMVVRTQDKDNAVYQKLLKAYHSDEVKQFINDEFKGSVLATW